MQEVLKIVVPIIVVHLVVLTGVILVIKRLLWNDTMRAVEKINQVEAEVRKKEEAIRREIEEHERDFARRRNEAEQDLQKHKEQSEKELNQLREKLVGLQCLVVRVVVEVEVPLLLTVQQVEQMAVLPQVAVVRQE